MAASVRRDVRRSIPASAGETRRNRKATTLPAVHPRECGGNTGPSRHRPRWTGPSPRVRGKPGAATGPCACARSIPASAGETPPRTAAGPIGKVHPRECGGNSRRWTLSASGCGPSPRVRGKLLAAAPLRLDGGSIPASAGETGDFPHRYDERGVHPRECGGNGDPPLDVRQDRGPSPRVRGKHFALKRSARPRGSILASAGETAADGDLGFLDGVHPRECGGNNCSGTGLLW